MHVKFNTVSMMLFTTAYKLFTVFRVYRFWKLNTLMIRSPTTVAAATPMPAFHHDEFSPVRFAKCFKCLETSKLNKNLKTSDYLDPVRPNLVIIRAYS